MLAAEIRNWTVDLQPLNAVASRIAEITAKGTEDLHERWAVGKMAELTTACEKKREDMTFAAKCVRIWKIYFFCKIL